MARVAIIGDIHGCLDELQQLVRGIGACDRVISVGDLVAKGPDSQGVVQFAREHNLEAVRGNHDDAVLRLCGTVPRDSEEKVSRTHETVARTLRSEDVDYLRSLPLYLELEASIVVHAGLDPSAALGEQKPRNLMNMRSIDGEGRIGYRARDGAPWAAHWNGPQVVYFGHDAVRGLQKHAFAVGLDTGCVYGNSLTACVITNGQSELISVPAKHVYARTQGAGE